MEFYIISILISIAAARPSNEVLTPTTYVLGTPIQSQYHSQDSLGQYAYGYNDGLSAKVESRFLDGTTQGGYTYYDANGQLQSISYIADDQNGFRVAGTNLPKVVPLPEPQVELQKLQQPQSVAETPEVAAARLQHLKAIDEAKTRNAQSEIENNLKINDKDTPKPVEDTPEVAKAKEEHFAAVKEVQLRNSNLLKFEISQPSTFVPLPQPKLEALPLHAVKLLPTSLQPVALLNGSTFKARPLAYDATNYGWSYGYTNLSPFGSDSRYFYAG